MTTIPASEIVAVNPSVLSAGGSALDVIGLMLTNSTRAPIGTVQSFPTAAAVQLYFGAGSTEATLAANYFSGFDNAQKLPGALLFAQYNQSAVAAYIRGGDISAYTLAQLQAISGTLTVIMDGDTRTAGSLNLSAATSFSSGAAIIQTALNASLPTEASVTASVGSVFTGSIATTTLTVSAVTQGIIRVGDVLSGTGVTALTTITALGTGSGGTGTYTVSISQTAGSTTITGVNNVLNVTAVGSGTLAVGQTVTGGTIAASTTITALGTGTGGTGTYTLSGAKQQSNSGTVTATSTALTVAYDSTSGAYILTSGITGTISTAAFATGTTAASLKLTSATGAVLSQGAAAAVPGTFMDGIVAITTDWVTFMTTFDPDVGVNTNKLAFAAWKDTQNNRYAYICADTDVTPTASSNAAASLGRLLEANGDSGSCLVWAAAYTDAAKLAAFVCGACASIDFGQLNGRLTLAFKSQAGMAATVTDATVASNLLDNKYCFYGAYASANNNFVWFQNGQCSGDFRWLDSYINQVWLNDELQVALLTLFANALSVPYGVVGKALISAACADPIVAGLNFGAFGPGDLSAAQATLVNTAADARVSDTIETQGWYLLIGDATAAVRAARDSPPCTLWYLDRGSIQKITFSSVAIQ